MYQFKVGDRFKVVGGLTANTHCEGDTGVVVKVHGNNKYDLKWDKDGTYTTYWTNDNDMKLISSSNMKTLKEKFALKFKKEPEKSFIKAGILDMNENLTEEGREVFESYLLKKFGEDFKTEVVDPILSEKDEE